MFHTEKYRTLRRRARATSIPTIENVGWGFQGRSPIGIPFSRTAVPRGAPYKWPHQATGAGGASSSDCQGPRHVTLKSLDPQFENCSNTAKTRYRWVADKEVKAPWKRPARGQPPGSANRGANSRTLRRTKCPSYLVRSWRCSWAS